MAASTAQGAPSSSSPCGYHVFLSFRGEDTRKRFTDHLYKTLVNAGFRTFRDEDHAEKGEPIGSELEKAIQMSRRSFAEAFDGYDKRIKEENDEKKNEWMKKVKIWREALQEVADLGGEVLRNEGDGYETKFITKLVKILEYKVNRDVFVESKLPGIDSRVKEINFWLQNESSSVGIMAICGVSGIGKTTIAQYAFDLNLDRFEGSSFLSDIKKVSKQWDGLVQLQRKLLSDIQKRKVRKITSVREGIIEIRDALHFRKVLVVLDDVDEKDQLNAILSMHKFFHRGSKILITTTNMQLLRSYEVKIIDVGLLSDDESLDLLSWHAFGQHCPIEGYMEYSKRVVKQCGGLPLALEVLGASLRDMGEDVWRSALDRFEVIQDSKIQQKLRISYDFLPDEQHKNLFLEIACFFVGMDKTYVVTILNGCGYFGQVELQALIDRYLIKVEHNKLMMHTLIQRMGREIIRQPSPEKIIPLGERSRLWNHKDSFKVLKEKIGTEKIIGLALEMNMLEDDKHPMKVSNFNNRYDGSLETDAFRRMHEVRLLQINYVRLIGSYKKFPRNIRWLCWHGFSLKSFPNDFPMENLVSIDMRNSSLEQLWKGTKFIGLLKILDLRHCHGLKKTPIFFGLPSLERLILKGCVNLVEVHESIGNLGKLVLLNMKDCKSLAKLPANFGMLSSLETLDISGCSNLEELPSELKKIKLLKTFEANEMDLSLLPSIAEENRSWHPCIWLGRLRPRTCLELSKIVLGVLPHSLVTLSLEGCNLSDGDFPKDFSTLPLLKALNLSRNPIRNLPDCVKGLDRLDRLEVDYCTSLKTLTGLPRVRMLGAYNCISLEKITYASSLASTASFRLNYCESLTEMQGLFRLEPLANIDEEFMDYWGVPDVESIKSIEVSYFNLFTSVKKKLPIQGLFEDGIFSIFLPWATDLAYFNNLSLQSSMYFKGNLVGNRRIHSMIMWCVYGITEENFPGELSIEIEIKNVCNAVKSYLPACFGVPEPDEYILCISHWKFDKFVVSSGDELYFQISMRGLGVKGFEIFLIGAEQEGKDVQSNSEDMIRATSAYRNTKFVLDQKDLILCIILFPEWIESIFPVHLLEDVLV